MAQYPQTPDLLARIADLEERLATLEHADPPVPDEVPFWAVDYNGLTWDDSTTWTTVWETTITPRAALLSMELVLVGDQVGGVSTGGEWQVRVTGASGTSTVASGTVPANFSYVRPVVSLDLSPYLTDPSLRIEIQTRRTAGATSGGRTGSGGSIGSSLRFARLL